MSLKLKILLIVGSINICSNDLILSFNKIILNDLEFVQETNISSEIQKSTGKVIRKSNFLEVLILEPSKEKYVIKDNIIEVYDFEFNQTSYIDINDQESNILNFLINGINIKNVKEISDKSFIINEFHNLYQVELKSESELSVTFKDNMNFVNTINFKSLN
jgi:hypothetical protein